ncbi:MAG: PKD domain-containing protein [Candidatus Kapabacteria bacterium]|nr:PKD domain-containing protein [Candidatus Kapabacteria bacterium]
MNTKLPTLILYLFFFVLSIGYKSYSCPIIEVPLEERVTNSNLVIEGKIIGKFSLWNDEKNLILTIHKVKIFKVFKGNIQNTEIEILTEGGKVGDVEHIIYPNDNLNIDDYGIFCLERSEYSSLSGYKGNFFRIYATKQGFIKYDKLNDVATDYFREYKGLPQKIYEIIEKLTGLKYKEIQKNELFNNEFKDNRDKPLVTINSFTPTSITAGTGAILAINGTDFGAARGSVRFRNADNGGIDYITVTGATSIPFWSNTDILVIVPKNACSGTIQVVTTLNEVATSSTSLVVPYAVQSASETLPIFLVNLNGSGGYTFRFSQPFLRNTAALNAFLRALETWRCGTYVNFGYTLTPVQDSCPSYNNVNTITFTNQNCDLSAGIIAQTRFAYTNCGTGAFFYEMDIIFKNGTNWNFDFNRTCTACIDFQSVALHELGHCHSLGHSCGTNDVMYYSIPNNVERRFLNYDSDLAGGNFVMDSSRVFNRCSRSPMEALNSSNCSVTYSPIAKFGVSATQGCQSLVVNFNDQSENNPTNWSWDIDNNGTYDYFTQNPSHTYNSPGTYSVKLKVSNAIGSDSLIKINLIKVYPAPTPDFLGDLSVCENDSAVYTTTKLTGNSYLWSVVGGRISGANNSDTLKVIWLGGPNGSITLKQTVDSTGCTDSLTKNVVINPLPAPKITGDDRLCFGSQTFYKVQAKPNLVSRWTVDGGLINGPNDKDSVSITWNSAGSNTVKVIQTDTLSGCRDSASYSVIVNPLPVVEFFGETNTCLNSQNLYYIKGNDSLSYYWSVSNGRMITNRENDSLTVVWDNLGQGKIKVVFINDTTGCMDSLSFNVTINQAPKNPISGDTVVCQNTIGNYLAKDDPDIKYLWKANNGTIIGSDSNYQVQVLWEVRSKNRLTLVQKDLATGCIDSTILDVTVNSLPRPSFIASTDACLGCLYKYGANSANLLYKWEAYKGNIVGDNDKREVNVRWSEEGTGSIKLVVVDPRTNCKDSLIKNIEIKKLDPPPIIISSDVCEGTFDTVFTTNNQIYSLKWKVTGATLGTNEINPFAIVYWTNVGICKIKLVRTIQFYDYIDSSEKQVTVNPKPQKPAILREGDNLISSISATEYDWYLDDLLIATNTQNLFKPTKSGTYKLKIRNGFGCYSDFSDPVNVSIVSVDDFTIHDKTLIKPNPASDNISIELINPNFEEIVIKLFDNIGREVSGISPVVLNNIIQIDLNQIPQGIYTILIREGTKNYIGKIVVIK